MVTALRQADLTASGLAGISTGPSVADTQANGGTIVAPTAPTVNTSTSAPQASPTAVVSSSTASNDISTNISPTVDTASKAIADQAAQKAAADKAAADKAAADKAAALAANGGKTPTAEDTIANTPDAGNMFVYDKATGARSEVKIGTPVASTQTTVDVANAPAQDTVTVGGTTYKQFSDGTYGAYDGNGKYIGGATVSNFADAKGVQKAQSDLLSIQNGTYPLNPGQQAQLDSITKYYNDLIEQQKVINANVTGNTTGLENLYGVGGTSVGTSEINRTIQEGAAKIAEINRKMVDAVESLKSAIQTDDTNLINKLYSSYKTGLDDKQKQLDGMHDDIVNAAKAQAAQIASVNDSYARKYMDTTTPILPSDTPEQVKAKLETSPTYQQDQKTKAGQVDQDVLDGMLTIYKKQGIIPAGMGNASVALKKAFYAAIGNTPSTADEATVNKAAITASTAALKTQQTQYSATQTSSDTMKKSLDLVDEISKKVDKTGSPIVDQYILWTQGKAAGNADIAALNAAITTAATEYAKIMSGASASIAGVSVSSADDVKKVLDANMSKGQIDAVMDVMRKDANYRLTSQKGTIDQIQNDIRDIGSTPTASASATSTPSTSKVETNADGTLKAVSF